MTKKKNMAISKLETSPWGVRIRSSLYAQCLGVILTSQVRHSCTVFLLMIYRGNTTGSDILHILKVRYMGFSCEMGNGKMPSNKKIFFFWLLQFWFTVLSSQDF